MAVRCPQQWIALVRKELQEYRNVLVVTPLILAVVVILVMLASVMLASRVGSLGDTLMEVVLEGDTQARDISIRIENGRTEITRRYRMEPGNGPATDTQNSQPGANTGGEQVDKSAVSRETEQGDSLNLILNFVHLGFLLVLFLVSGHYLLGSLFNDRREHSILFYKSMPVSDRVDVLTRFAVVIAVAPAIYIAVSILAQLASTALAMVLVWRTGRDPVTVILHNIQLLPLVIGQLTGWFLTALWLAPLYAWLLLASAAARKSPFLMALGPIVALVVLERMLFGTRHVADTVWRHIPHADDGSSMGFYPYGLDWATQDLPGLFVGLTFAGLTLAATIYLRHSRFDV